jgi:hypothetical protein
MKKDARVCLAIANAIVPRPNLHGPSFTLLFATITFHFDNS